ncbi:ImmA/IrrE family metallo-endopeptidase [Pantoea sp. Mb-10]|uniref:ImmA/IrrE family metallo-endopeptidase n=1 Tax=unclassified Pantoea TaxID=2630326 RepID=UPI001E60FD77|nr:MULTISPECIES: ImmA/IrrE family metallo-endopeptidase [unclassified Pantoea]MCE0490335.1 ImmA/IrrE family metallo-endopeptidase [Pantoea sp. Mb-10]MCE0501466.1 ImmA/IrrE family metallo-endopeptidase [Pantoea sp. Pb-8]
MDLKPKAEANKISKMLNLVLGNDRFPVDIEKLALEYSQQTSPNDRISKVKSEVFEGIEGALVRHPSGTKWKILYNENIKSDGRRRFTIAHEFGHYILHRAEMNEFLCSSIAGEKSSAPKDVENEADTFASYLLMPLDDFRKQLTDQKFSIELLIHCASRYGVSLMAAALKLKEIIPKRIVVVAARDGMLLWAAPNEKAYKSGAYIKTKGVPPVSLPENSLMSSLSPNTLSDIKTQPARIWFPNEPEGLTLIEHVFIATEGYDYTLGVLELENFDGYSNSDKEDSLLNPLNGRLQLSR